VVIDAENELCLSSNIEANQTAKKISYKIFSLFSNNNKIVVVPDVFFLGKLPLIISIMTKYPLKTMAFSSIQ